MKATRLFIQGVDSKAECSGKGGGLAWVFASGGSDRVLLRSI